MHRLGIRPLSRVDIQFGKKASYHPSVHTLQIVKLSEPYDCVYLPSWANTWDYTAVMTEEAISPESPSWLILVFFIVHHLPKSQEILPENFRQRVSPFKAENAPLCHIQAWGWVVLSRTEPHSVWRTSVVLSASSCGSRVLTANGSCGGKIM